jgi:hypothetical protein
VVVVSFWDIDGTLERWNAGTDARTIERYNDVVVVVVVVVSFWVIHRSSIPFWVMLER